MLKKLATLLIGTLCFVKVDANNFLERFEQLVNSHEDTREGLAQASTINEISQLEDLSGVNEVVLGDIVENEGNILRLHWNIVPDAVKYEIFIDGAAFITYTNGLEIPVNNLDAKFQVNAISFDGATLQNNLTIIDIEKNPTAPLTMTEFDKMISPPIYPVYSWIPVYGADHYEIELICNGKIIRRYYSEPKSQDDIFDFYETEPIINTGEYFWRVRGISIDNHPITNWSVRAANNTFTVGWNSRFCALGDSITHGGGSISVPPSNVIYNWETYCSIPVKNLGHSGDTTAEVLARFDREVLPCHPEVLFIMAGVNDFRMDISSAESIRNLSIIRDKCINNGIKPVFLTPTPINPAQIQKVGFIEMPPQDWQKRQRDICQWIRQQEYFIDINDQLIDSNGNLSENLSIDGLHPDLEGKKIIGAAVENWLNKYLK